MSQYVTIGFFLFIGCGEKRDPFPYASESDEASESSDGGDETPPADCVDTWNLVADEVVIQPEVCIAWSPPSAEGMTWYEAASIEDGEAGSCGNDCPDGAGYCATLNLDGRTDWRLPSFNELKDAALSRPDIPDVDGKLWSRKSGQGSTSNAWVVDLGQPGIWLELDKEDSGIGVRCVSDS